MTTSEQTLEALEARSTSGSSFVTTTCLAALILCAQYNTSIVPSSDRIVVMQTPGSASSVSSVRAAGQDIFEQFCRVYSELLQSQIDLDVDAKRALYENLWDLYT